MNPASLSSSFSSFSSQTPLQQDRFPLNQEAAKQFAQLMLTFFEQYSRSSAGVSGHPGTTNMLQYLTSISHVALGSVETEEVGKTSGKEEQKMAERRQNKKRKADRDIEEKKTKKMRALECIHCGDSKPIIGRNVCDVCKAIALRPLQPPFSQQDLRSLYFAHDNHDWHKEDRQLSQTNLEDLAKNWRCWKCQHKGVVGPFTYRTVLRFDRRCRECATCKNCDNTMIKNGGHTCIQCSLTKLKQKGKSQE